VWFGDLKISPPGAPEMWVWQGNSLPHILKKTLNLDQGLYVLPQFNLMQFALFSRESYNIEAGSNYW
jgi:hypothetical protein